VEKEERTPFSGICGFIEPVCPGVGERRPGPEGKPFEDFGADAMAESIIRLSGVVDDMNGIDQQMSLCYLLFEFLG